MTALRFLLLPASIIAVIVAVVAFSPPVTPPLDLEHSADPEVASLASARRILADQLARHEIDPDLVIEIPDGSSGLGDADDLFLTLEGEYGTALIWGIDRDPADPGLVRGTPTRWERFSAPYAEVDRLARLFLHLMRTEVRSVSGSRIFLPMLRSRPKAGMSLWMRSRTSGAQAKELHRCPLAPRRDFDPLPSLTHVPFSTKDPWLPLFRAELEARIAGSPGGLPVEAATRSRVLRTLAGGTRDQFGDQPPDTLEVIESQLAASIAVHRAYSDALPDLARLSFWSPSAWLEILDAEDPVAAIDPEIRALRPDDLARFICLRRDSITPEVRRRLLGRSLVKTPWEPGNAYWETVMEFGLSPEGLRALRGKIQRMSHPEPHLRLLRVLFTIDWRAEEFDELCIAWNSHRTRRSEETHRLAAQWIAEMGRAHPEVRNRAHAMLAKELEKYARPGRKHRLEILLPAFAPIAGPDDSARLREIFETRGLRAALVPLAACDVETALLLANDPRGRNFDPGVRTDIEAAIALFIGDHRAVPLLDALAEHPRFDPKETMLVAQVMECITTPEVGRRVQLLASLRDDPAGRIDRSIFPRLADRLVEQGATGPEIEGLRRFVPRLPVER